MDYYKILNVNLDCSKEEIKKNYHKLCLKYHPDKNDGDDIHFKKINEAYETLSNDKKRKIYFFKKLFNYDSFNDSEYELLSSYYDKLLASNEFKLMILIYKSMPDHIKINMYNRYKSYRCKDIIKSEKTIDITKLNISFNINLKVSKNDIKNNKLKILHVITKNGIYYLYLRKFNNIIIDNNNCNFYINFI